METSWRPYLVELIGTFAFVFVSAGVVCADYLAARPWPPASPPESVIVQPQPGLLGIAAATGAIYAVALVVTIAFSNGYLNPAIPIALWVLKKMDFTRAIGLVLVQLLGALLAGGLLRVLFWFREDVLVPVHLGTPHLNLRMFDLSSVTPLSLLTGIGIEMVLTFVVALVILVGLMNPQPPRWWGGKRWGCQWAGLAVAAATLVGFPFTGAALNPARWLGCVVWELTVPALQMQRPFQDHVIYWCGPIAGAVAATLIYGLVFSPSAEPEAAPPPPSKTPTGSSATLFRSRS